LKSWDSTKRYLSNKPNGIFGLATNSNLKLAKNNFGLKYPIDKSTLESIEGDFTFFSFELT
jgi:hypothetical protein